MPRRDETEIEQGHGAWPSERRLRALPWDALAGHGPTLEPVLAEVLAGAPAERALRGLLRRLGGAIDRRTRQALAEAIFGVSLWRLRLEVGGVTAPLQLLVRLARELGGASGAAEALGLADDDVPRLPEPQSFPERFSLPGWLAEELVAAVGEQAEALADALCLPAPVALRANLQRCTRDALAARLEAEGVRTRPSTLAPHGLVVTSERPPIYGLQSFHDGWFEVQDEGSQLLTSLAGVRPGARVLDLCAGAGGKTLPLAEAAGPAGLVVATDVDEERLARLRARAGKAGVPWIRTVARGAIPDEPWDVVLVDAPCSELGPLRRGPDLRHRLDPQRFPAIEALQLTLLEEALARVRPGGRVLYATCTFRRAENEAIVEQARGGRRQALALPPALATPAGDLQTLPHRHGCDGFYAALLAR